MSEQATVDATPTTEVQEPIVAETTTEVEGLGDAGKQAIERMKQERAAAKAATAAAIARAEAAEAALAAKDKSAEEIALESARREGTETATKAANLKLAKSALKLAAATKLANPEDALAFIDPASIDIDANGDADSDALNTRIAELLTVRPYLAAKTSGFGGGADGGSSAHAKPTATLAEQIAAANAAGNTKLAISLKNTQLKFGD